MTFYEIIEAKKQAAIDLRNHLERKDDLEGERLLRVLLNLYVDHAKFVYENRLKFKSIEESLRLPGAGKWSR